MNRKILKTSRFRCFFLSLILLFLSLIPTAGAEDADSEATAFLNFENQKTEFTATSAATEFGVEEGSLGLHCKSAILMEAETGKILYLQNAEEALPPASVTKVMTLLLIMEAIDSEHIRLTDTVTASANAASMGGSQIYLKEGEQMTVEDLLKSIVVASANDAAVALAEHVSGSVTAFVDQMNQKAKKLGMNQTHFENPTGLDDSAANHLTCARDIAIMSRELLRHTAILRYTGIWMDTIREGAFGLTNTNRLIRYFKGCNGLKTGSTAKAGFCISATAERDGMTLIAVIMGATSRDERNEAAASLLEWGFSRYALFEAPAQELASVAVHGGEKTEIPIFHNAFSAVVQKEALKNVETVTAIPEFLTAPISANQTVGTVIYKIGEQTVGEIPILAGEEDHKLTYFGILFRTLVRFLLV